MIKNILAYEIKTARRNFGIGDTTLAELSSIVGIPQTTLRDYESGRREPGAGNLFRLARIVGLDLNKLAKQYFGDVDILEDDNKKTNVELGD